jgi:hypothetical protein
LKLSPTIQPLPVLLDQFDDLSFGFRIEGCSENKRLNSCRKSVTSVPCASGRLKVSQLCAIVLSSASMRRFKKTRVESLSKRLPLELTPLRLGSERRFSFIGRGALLDWGDHARPDCFR